MIIEALISILTSIIVAFQSIFPVATPGADDSSIFNAIDYFFNILHKGDNFLPITTMLHILGLILITETLFWTFDLTVFIYKRFRG